MKRIVLIIAALFVGKGLMAQHSDSQNILEKLIWDDKMLNIMVDTRVDYQTDFQNSDYTNGSFQAQTFKLWVVGEIVPGIRYRIRHRLNRAQDPLSRERFSAATDQAWVAFDIGQHWTITAGKQSVQFGTFEYDYNPADIYVGTMCFNDLDAYKTGVNAAYKFLGQTIHLQVFNSDNPQFASDDYASKAIAVAAMWEGSLFKDIIKTRVGYAALQHDKDIFRQWITPGLQFNIGKFTAETDYYLGTRNMNYGSIVGDDNLGTSYVRDQSASLNLKYDFGIFKPFVKGVWSQRYNKDFNENAYQDAGIQAVLEVYPFKGLVKDLRFHAMYSYNVTDFKGRYSDMTKQYNSTILVGMRWLFKAK